MIAHMPMSRLLAYRVPITRPTVRIVSSGTLVHGARSVGKRGHVHAWWAFAIIVVDGCVSCYMGCLEYSPFGYGVAFGDMVVVVCV